MVWVNTRACAFAYYTLHCDTDNILLYYFNIYIILIIFLLIKLL